MTRKRKTQADAPGVVAALSYTSLFRQELASLDIPEDDFPSIGWEPNPCYLCSPNFLAKKKGFGKVLTDDGATVATITTIPCPACTGDNRPPELAGYGPQARALVRPEYEIFYGGQKGGAKSNAMTIWMSSGNPSEPEFNEAGNPLLINRSYTYHPAFRGLVLRKNATDLKAWVHEASYYYGMLGGTYVDNEFRFPSGATIWTGHLEDSTAYEKYQGIPELHRVAIEEICQIPEIELYMQILSCIRSKTPGLRPQIFLTANPIGPGLSWVGERFVKVLDANGRRIPPETRIADRVRNPYTGDIAEIDRVFISAGLRDNPYLLQDATYVTNLARMPEKLRKAYMDGDWDALAGTFFSEFRASGALSGEPVNANHVIGPRNTATRITEKNESIPAWTSYPEIKSWWPRSIGCDIGYSHHTAVILGARDPDTDIIHVYREIVYQATGYEVIGADLARQLYPELRSVASNSMTMWMARDAFQHRGDDQGIRSHIQLIQRGMAKILGQNAVHCPDLEIETRREREGLPRSGFTTGMNQEELTAFTKWEEELRTTRRMGINIRKCNSNRTLGWSYLRDLLNWTPPPQMETSTFDPDVYAKLFQGFSTEKAVEYLEAYNHSTSTYPQLQIWEDHCPHLISAIPRAVHDDKNPEDVAKKHFDGMDELDALRYMALGLDDGVGVDAPFEEFKAKAIQNWERNHPGATTQDRVFLHDWLTEREQKQFSGGESFNVGREARSGRRSARRQWASLDPYARPN